MRSLGEAHWTSPGAVVIHMGPTVLLRLVPSSAGYSGVHKVLFNFIILTLLFNNSCAIHVLSIYCYFKFPLQRLLLFR